MIESRRLWINPEAWSAARIRSAVSNAMALLESHGLTGELSLANQQTLAVLGHVQDDESDGASVCDDCGGLGWRNGDQDTNASCKSCSGSGLAR